MKNKVMILLLVGVMPLGAFAQGHSTKHTKHKTTHKTTKLTQAVPAKPMPTWAEPQHYDASAHVYFPDYYTYYDPNRGGYVYWDNGQYTFTPGVPAFMEKVDLSKSRIQILKGLSLSLHPESDYPRYMKMYPPDPNGNANVPVPTQGNPRQ